MANLEQLAQRLQSESEPDRLAAVTELATQADQRNVDDAVHIPMMRQEGLMAAVVKISEAGGEDAQAQAFMAVTRIARAVANVRPLLAFPGLVDSAISTTKTSTGLARQWACAALGNIAFTDENMRDMYQNEILVSALLDVVRTDTGEARAKACGALSNISAASSNHLDMASNAPLRSTLVALAKDESAGEANMYAIMCIAKFARSASTAPILLGADILPTMMDVVRKAGPDLSKWGPVFELLKRSPAATGQLVDLLKNTLLCIDTKGKGVGYLYGVYPLHSSLNAAKVLSHSDGFKGYLLSKEVFPLLHRVLAEYVENRGGGKAGGGGDDLECACIAILALFELSHPPSSSSSSATASLEYALSTVATYSDASLTPLVSLLSAFIEKATAAVGTVFYDPAPAIATAESLLTRLNAAKSTVALAKVKSKLVRRKSIRPASSEPEKKNESAANAELAAQLREAQLQLKAQLEQHEKEKLQREAEKKALADLMASQQADVAAETKRLADIREEKEAVRDVARGGETKNQMDMVMAMLAEMKTVVEDRTSAVLEGQADLKSGQAKILNMSAATMSLVEESTSKLCKVVFEATEVSTPTCFVILPYELPGANASEAEKKSMLGKAENWVGIVTNLVEEGTGLIKSPVQYAKSFFGGVFKKKIAEVKAKTVEKTLYLYLVDEYTHKPVEDEGGVYPIEIETKSELVDKYMPMMRVGLQAMSVANGAAALAKVFCPWLPVAPASFLEKAKGFVDGLDKDSSAADYSSVQDEVDGAGGGGAKRGGELRDFEDFLKKHDGGRKFAGLMRVCDMADGTAIWVTPDSAARIEASNTTLPRAQAKLETAVALDATLNAPISPQKSGASLLERARAVFVGIRGEEAPPALNVKEVVAACEEDLELKAEGGMKARIEILEQNV
ncbi:hypothetical protein TeGR_g9993 [Tetraparma gracilis]|uniref:Uncharacterized protein n=1 Tax=Tetraparma gracilis TaxID=2962635 RepID=A0ABQ6N778_9STRA|nr:hypothetical protein TeGR_g9993 [Tetraparma gracilis]